MAQGLPVHVLYRQTVRGGKRQGVGLGGGLQVLGHVAMVQRARVSVAARFIKVDARPGSACSEARKATSAADRSPASKARTPSTN